MADYKHTINLPETGFPMKADLAQREPKMLAAWEQNDLYGKLRAIARGRPRFVLHDGPPYANGALHLGHAVNKVLKDIVVKSHTLDGYDSPVRAGLGLPRPAHRTRGGERSTAASAPRSTRRISAPPAASSRRSRSNCSAASSSASACWATGIVRISRWTRVSRPSRSARWATSSGTDTYIRVPSRSTGASTAVRRWPRRKWNTRTRPRPPSTWNSASSTTAELARRVGVNPDVLGAFPVSHPDLDHHALDAARQRGGEPRAQDRIRAALGVAQRLSPSC